MCKVCRIKQRENLQTTRKCDFAVQVQAGYSYTLQCLQDNPEISTTKIFLLTVVCFMPNSCNFCEAYLKRSALLLRNTLSFQLLMETRRCEAGLVWARQRPFNSGQDSVSSLHWFQLSLWLLIWSSWAEFKLPLA